MAYQTTFYGLKADILVKVEDQSDEVLTVLDETIASSESQVIRDLDLDIFQDEFAAGNLTAGDRVFTPTGVLKINSIYLMAGTVRTFIEKRLKGYCEVWSPDSSVQARPTYWAPSGGSTNTPTLMFYDTPDQVYAVIIDGIQRPPGLSDANPTTWISTYAGDLLLLACCINLEEYLSAAGQVQSWKGEYQDRIVKAKLELRGMSRSTYEAAKSVGQPSLQT